MNQYDAAELAVGDGLQPDLLLHSHDLADRAVLDGAQVGRDLAASLPLPRIEQLLRAQEAADVIGAEWRCRAGGHGGHPFERCGVSPVLPRVSLRSGAAGPFDVLP